MTSSLLSRQLRDSVNASMSEMLSFFRWAGQNPFRSAFRLRLKVNDVPLVYRAPLEDKSSSEKEHHKYFRLSPNMSKIVAMTESLILQLTDADKQFPSSRACVFDGAGSEMLKIFRMLPTSAHALRARLELRKCIEKNREGPEQFRDSFAEFVTLFDGTMQKRIENLLEQCEDWLEHGIETDERDDKGKLVEPDAIAHSLDALTKEIQSLDALSKRVLNFAEDVVHFPMFTVDCSSFKGDLHKQLMSLRYRLVESVVLANREAMKSMCTYFFSSFF